MNPMGESDRISAVLSFNRAIRLSSRDDRMTADVGALGVRLANDLLLGSGSDSSRLLRKRRKYRTKHSEKKILRTLITLQALGYSKLSDVCHLREDPAIRLAVSSRRGVGAIDDELPSQSTLSRFLRRLSGKAQRQRLQDLLVEQAARAVRAEGPRPYGVTLDIDSAPIESHGVFGGSAHNGYYRTRCFHPLFVMLGHQGHLVAAELRAGNVSSNHDAIETLMKTIERVRTHIGQVNLVRGDSGFMSPKMLKALESERVGYIIRVNHNTVLDRIGEEFRGRPPGRRPIVTREWVDEVEYRAARWDKPRRVIVVTQERPDSLYLHQFFLVTNTHKTPQRILAEYRQRGTAEARLGEWKSTVPPTLSCTTRARGEKSEQDRCAAFTANCAAFAINALAYNTLHTIRRLTGCPRRTVPGDGGFSLARTRRLTLTIAARVIRSQRRLVFLLPRHAAMAFNQLVESLELRRVIVAA